MQGSTRPDFLALRERVYRVTRLVVVAMERTELAMLDRGGHVLRAAEARHDQILDAAHELEGAALAALTESSSPEQLAAAVVIVRATAKLRLLSRQILELVSGTHRVAGLPLHSGRCDGLRKPVFDFQRLHESVTPLVRIAADCVSVLDASASHQAGESAASSIPLLVRDIRTDALRAMQDDPSLCERGVALITVSEILARISHTGLEIIDGVAGHGPRGALLSRARAGSRPGAQGREAAGSAH